MLCVFDKIRVDHSRTYSIGSNWSNWLKLCSGKAILVQLFPVTPPVSMEICT